MHSRVVTDTPARTRAAPSRAAEGTTTGDLGARRGPLRSSAAGEGTRARPGPPAQDRPRTTGSGFVVGHPAIRRAPRLNSHGRGGDRGEGGLRGESRPPRPPPGPRALVKSGAKRHPIGVQSSCGRIFALAALIVAATPGEAAAKRLIERKLLRADAVRPRPRLQLALSPVLGPYSRGEQDCRPRGPIFYCEDGGSFLGAGASLELRLKSFGPFYFHVRGLLVGNTHRRPWAAYDGLGGAGFGFGAYARLAFIRGEYLSIDTFGSPRYRPPFGERGGATDLYGHHAGMISGGVRLPFRGRWNVEAWGGFVIGPRGVRTTPREVSVGDRTMVSFLLGLGISFDVIRGSTAGP